MPRPHWGKYTCTPTKKLISPQPLRGFHAATAQNTRRARAHPTMFLESQCASCSNCYRGKYRNFRLSTGKISQRVAHNARTQPDITTACARALRIHTHFPRRNPRRINKVIQVSPVRTGVMTPGDPSRMMTPDDDPSQMMTPGDDPRRMPPEPNTASLLAASLGCRRDRRRRLSHYTWFHYTSQKDWF